MSCLYPGAGIRPCLLIKSVFTDASECWLNKKGTGKCPRQDTIQLVLLLRQRSVNADRSIEQFRDRAIVFGMIDQLIEFGFV